MDTERGIRVAHKALLKSWLHPSCLDGGGRSSEVVNETLSLVHNEGGGMRLWDHLYPAGLETGYDVVFLATVERPLFPTP